MPTDSSMTVKTVSSAGGVTTEDVSFAGSGLNFVNQFTASVTQAYENCILAAEQQLASIWTNATTIDIQFQAQAGGTNGFLASNSWRGIDVSYSALSGALTSLSSQENNPILREAVATLPSSDPSGGAGFVLPVAYAQMLGLTSVKPGVVEDTVTLNTSYNWTYGQDVINTIEHEISEGGMGRVGGLGDQNRSWSTMDLFRYNSSGAPDYTDGRDGSTTFFSYNGGATLSSLAFNNEYNANGVLTNRGDTADFVQPDVFGTGFPGETSTLSQTDLQVMDALGWSPASLPPPPSTPGGTTSFMFLRDAAGNFALDDLGANQVLASLPLGRIALEWKLAGAGAFNGSDTADMMMRDAQTGALEIYDVSNSQITGVAPLGNVGADWRVAGFGHFAGNSNETDMMMREARTGAFELYDIANDRVTGAAAIGAVGVEWKVAGFGDFSDNPSETDMLLRDSKTGDFELYDISHNQLTGAASLGNVGLDWKVVGFGDFSGNSNETDMMMRDSRTGDFELYDVSGGRITGATSLGSVGMDWTVAGFGHVGSAGETDMLLRNRSTGDFEVYDIVGNRIVGTQSLGNAPLAFSVQGFGSNLPGGT